MGGLVNAWMPKCLPLLGRRLVVVDPGSHCFKLLVAESVLGRLRVVQRQTIDLEEEGLLAPEEIHHHLESILPKLGPHSIGLVLPQHRAFTQVIDMGVGSVGELKKQLEAEVVRLSGLTEGAMLHGAVRLKPFGKHANPYWLTFCRASEIWDLVNRFGGLNKEGPDSFLADHVGEVTTTAQALLAASQVIQPRLQQAVLVDLGANHTVVAVVCQGQGVYACGFETGSGHFTKALAQERGCAPEEAELLKRSQNVLTGGQASPVLRTAVTEWHRELRQSVAEWLEENPELELTLESFPLYLCGGGACQEGLVEFLNGLGQGSFHPWPPRKGEESDWPMEPYWVAYGVALQALGKAARPVSLLPTELRGVMARQTAWQWLQVVNVLLLALAVTLLGVGTWQKQALAGRKRALIAETREALQTSLTLERLSRRLQAEYEQLQPVLRRQRQSADTLLTLAALQQAHTNRDFWYVLFADPVSYFSGTTMPLTATNQTNAASSLFPTNAAGPWREFVAELCIPQEGDETRKVLNYVVNELKRNPLFSRVDTLPTERRRNLVDGKVLITNRYFAVAMEIGGREAAAPVAAAEKGPSALPIRETKRPAPVRPKPERAGNPPGGTNQ